MGRERRPGQGLDLLLHRSARRCAELPPRAQRATSSARSRRSQGKRLLVVDDNATNRRILALQTAKWGMVARHRVAAGSAALARAGEAFDLAILDMHMPEMDGVALGARIRERRPDAAARAVQLARPARGAATPTSSSRLPGQAAPPVAALRHAGRALLAQRRRAAGRRRPAKPRSTPTMAARHPLRILLAEDNVVNQKLALRLLQQMGYRADLASNGIEAIESVERQTYDVVLMDVQMPEMDGLEATRRITAKWPRGRAPAHRRDDRQRDAGRPRDVPRRRHGRLPDQADPRRAARRSADAVAARGGALKMNTQQIADLAWAGQHEQAIAAATAALSASRSRPTSA